MFTRTYNNNCDMMWYILCWLGLTTSSVFHVDSDSQHWLWFYVIYLMLTVTNNIISISCWLGLKTLIMIPYDKFYVDWNSQHHYYCMLTRTHNTDYNIMWYISCWLRPTTSSVFHVDSDSQHWLSYNVMYHMLTDNTDYKIM